MAQTAQEARRFFLGIAGQQTGPYSEAEVWEKLRTGEITEITPLWFEGLADWQPLNVVPPFDKPEPAREEKPKIAYTPKAPSSSEESDGDTASTFAEGKESQPVFGRKAATFSRKSLWEQYGKYLVIGSIGVLFSGAAYYVFSSGGELIDVVQSATNSKKIPPPPETRETKMRRAQSELLLSPQSSIEVLREGWKQNPNDELGKQAFASLIDYYENRTPAEAGRLLVESGKYEEAIKYFLGETPSYGEAAQAYAKAAETTKDPAKQKSFLLEEIKILIGPAQSLETALQKLQAFERKYPGENHPYRYYLKNNEQKIQDIFDRISFHFVQSLLDYLDTEFKQTKLATRPKIEIRRESDGKYRLSGSYSGDINLSRDRLNNIKLVFWLIKGQWILVETNLTEQRQKWAKAEREKYRNDGQSAAEMLNFLETVFKTQFPKSALHEKPSLVKVPAPE